MIYFNYAWSDIKSAVPTFPNLTPKYRIVKKYQIPVSVPFSSIPRSSHRRCSVKKVFLEISRKFTGSFGISKNTFPTEHLQWLLLYSPFIFFRNRYPKARHVDHLWQSQFQQLWTVSISLKKRVKATILTQVPRRHLYRANGA